MANAQCIIGTETNPDAGVIILYDADFYSQGHGQYKEAFRDLTKDDTLKALISDPTLRSTDINDAGEDDNSVGYIFIRFRQKISGILRSCSTN